jgi:hypothetical protein
MKIYKLAVVKRGSGYIELQASDPKTLDWLFNELHTHLPNVQRRDLLHTLDTGAPYLSRFEGLDGKDGDVYWWVITQLCELGWEPFMGNDLGVYHLRLEVE